MRTRADWEAIITSSAASNGLTLSSSSVAEWKLWRDLIITIAMVLDGIYSIFTKETSEYLAKEQHGGLYWYGKIAKEFQYGDSLIVNDGILGYSPVNTAHQIVTQVSVKEIDDEVLVMKVAKTVSGVFTPLASGEFTSFSSYISKRKLPGTKINLHTLAGDLVYLDGQLYYDPLVDPSTLQTELFNALDVFRVNFGFDDILFRSALIEVLMSVPGIVGIGVMDIFVGGNYLDTYMELPSGYFNIDNSSLLDLAIAP